MVVTSAVFVAEATAYSTISPLLPHYHDAFGLSKSAGGVLVGAYAAGLIPGSILGAELAHRIGVRLSTFAGLIVFAAATAAFGFASNAAALDIARCVQGLAAGCMWGGALAWLLQAAPREREGMFIGTGLGFSIFGMLLGPPVGTLAVVLGPRPVFVALSIGILAIAFAALRLPSPAGARRRGTTPTLIAVRDRRVAVGVWVAVLGSAALGGVTAMVPLLMSEHGATSEVVGVTFTLAAFTAFGASRAVGRAVDKWSPLRVLETGLLSCAPFFVLIGVASTPLVLSGVTIAGMAVVMSAVMIPATALLALAGGELGQATSSIAMVLLFTIAVGETVGSPATTSLAAATSDAVPFVVIAGLALITLALILRLRVSWP